jgi:diacylglycerol kinase family enzyme
MMDSGDIILLNPRSGGDGTRSADVARLLVDRLRARGRETTLIRFPGAPGDGDWRHRLDASLDGGACAVYVLGGDGTVLAAARALLGRDLPLGIVPLGTANLLAMDLGLPADPKQALDALLASRVARIDVARCNRVPFLCAAMLGMPADLARAREAARGLGAWRLLPRMVRKLIWVLKRYPFHRVKLSLDGRAEHLSTRVMIVSNNPVDPNSPGINPKRPCLTTGQLGIYGVREGPLYDLPRLALTLLTGSWQNEPRVFSDSSTTACIHTKRPMGTAVLLDGEREHFTTPLHFDLQPGALPVLVPNRD